MILTGSPVGKAQNQNEVRFWISPVPCYALVRDRICLPSATLAKAGRDIIAENLVRDFVLRLVFAII